MKELYFSFSLVEDSNEMNEMLGNLLEIFVNPLFSIFLVSSVDLMAGTLEPYFSLRQTRRRKLHTMNGGASDKPGSLMIMEVP